MSSAFSQVLDGMVAVWQSQQHLSLQPHPCTTHFNHPVMLLLIAKWQTAKTRDCVLVICAWCLL